MVILPRFYLRTAHLKYTNLIHLPKARQSRKHAIYLLTSLHHIHTHGARRRRRCGCSSSPLSLASSSSSGSYSRFDAFPRAALLRTYDVIGDEETSRYRHDHYPSTDDSSGSSSLNKAGTKDAMKQNSRGNTKHEYDTDGSTYSSDLSFFN